MGLPLTSGRRKSPPPFGASPLSPEATSNDVTGNQEYIKIGNEATSKIATIVHQKR